MLPFSLCGSKLRDQKRSEQRYKNRLSATMLTLHQLPSSGLWRFNLLTQSDPSRTAFAIFTPSALELVLDTDLLAPPAEPELELLELVLVGCSRP